MGDAGSEVAAEPDDRGVRARRQSRGLAFPVCLFAVWRLLHLLVVLLLGGSASATTFAFDGGFYLSILRTGYVRPRAGYGEFSNVAFFPGLAWVTEPVVLVVRDERLAAAVVANALALAAFVTVWGAVRAWSDDVCARRAVVALALFPTSFYLWMYYSEALLVSTTAAAAWAGGRGRHLGATGFLALAATARVVGVVAGPALALARVVRLRRIDATAVLYLCGSAIGFVAVLARQQAELGDPLAWTKAQEAWKRGLAPPWAPVVTAVRDLVRTYPDVAKNVGLDLVTVFTVGLLVVLLYNGFRRGRWPVEPALLASALWFVPLCSRLIQSQIRFALVCWPILLVVACSWPRLGPLRRGALVVGAVALAAVLLHRLVLGIFTE